MNTEFLTNIRTLKNAISSKKLVVFAGAGISIDSGIPAWGQLINELKKDINISDDEQDFLKIAQIYYYERGEKQYQDKISKILKYKQTNYNALHEAIFNLNPEHIITTNFDDLLEQVIRKKAFPFSIVKRDKDFPFALNTNLLVKMHGDLELREFVLKEDDFLEYSFKYPLVEAFIKSVFTSKVVLFVGYSFSDINLKIIIQTVRNILDKSFQPAYLLSIDNNISPTQRQYFKSKGIQVIAYNDAGNSEKESIEEFLKEKNARNYNYYKEIRGLSDKGQRLYNFLRFICSYDPFIEETEKLHIVDQLVTLLAKFSELKVLPISFVANLYPFNIKKEYVHHFRVDSILTQNPRLTDLFYNQLRKDNLHIKSAFLKGFDSDEKKNYQDKFQKILRVLNNCLIFSIHKEKESPPNSLGNRGWSEGVEIRLIKNPVEVDNLIDNFYIQFNFNEIVKKVTNSAITETSNIYDDLMLAYIHYRLCDFKNSFELFDEAASKAWKCGNYMLYFILKFNIQKLRNFIQLSRPAEITEENKREILEKIEEIDLDNLLVHLSELDDSQRKLLKMIKENEIFENVKEQIDEYADKVKKAYKTNKNGDDLPLLITSELHKLLCFYIGNCIIYDMFTEFRNICQKAVEALIISYAASDLYEYRLKKFNFFQLSIVMLYCEPIRIKKVLEKYGVKSIQIDKNELDKLIKSTNNFLTSFFTVSSVFWRNVTKNRKVIAYTNNYFFRLLMENFLTSSLLILSKIKIDKNETENLITNLLDFLETEDFLTREDEYLASFIRENGYLFDQKQLERLLHIMVEEEKYFTNNLLEALRHCQKEYHEGFSIKDESVFTKMLLGLKKQHQWKGFLCLYHLADASYREKVLSEITNHLKAKFDYVLFYNACREDIIDYHDYFDEYLGFVNTYKDPTDPLKLHSGKIIRVSYRFNKFIEFIYIKDINLSEEQLSCFTNLIDYHRFLLNPREFDYQKFDARWLLIWRTDSYLTKFKKIPQIKDCLLTYLKSNADKELAGLYFEYFE